MHAASRLLSPGSTKLKGCGRAIEHDPACCSCHLKIGSSRETGRDNLEETVLRGLKIRWIVTDIIIYVAEKPVISDSSIEDPSCYGNIGHQKARESFDFLVIE